ncbi:MFS transporter [Paenibacillus daejeonensis]|uniref:MFS transporter n=1 Tax=Paenibacillus daejeonensis TaxID=135193 RepID=UPI0003803133|nr:MFS transporter [Paenibacillus daejeonensis]
MKRKAIRGWLMYDFANSAFATTILAAVMPVFYETVAGIDLPGNKAEVYWANTQTIAMLCVAILSPILGAIADHIGAKVRFLGVFMLMGALASSGLALAGEGDWLLASILAIIGSIGFSAGNTFYDALLPELAEESKRDEVSSQGYAYGYIGGGVLLAINVAMIQGWEMFGFPNQTVATQAAFATVGIWWLVFSIPLFRNVRDVPRAHGERIGSVVRTGVRRLGDTMRGIARFPELLKYMIAYWFFNNGINTVIIMATIYGSGIGIEMMHLIIALLITQFVGFPATLAFGKLASRTGAKRALYATLLFYMVIVTLGYFMTNAAYFYALAVMVGLVQGGSQALARSLYANLVPASKVAEFFGFLSLSGKFSSVAGPLLFSIVGTLTGSSRLAILSLIAFFVIGIVLLRFVSLEKGRREALAFEARIGG